MEAPMETAVETAGPNKFVVFRFEKIRVLEYILDSNAHDPYLSPFLWKQLTVVYPDQHPDLSSNGILRFLVTGTVPETVIKLIKLGQF